MNLISKQLFKAICLMLFVGFNFSHAKGKNYLLCQTLNNEKSFEVHEKYVSFNHMNTNFNSTILNRQRSLSSAKALSNSIKVLSRSKRMISNGVEKKLNFEGKDHLIHIENKDDLSNLDDYIIITARNGHSITYPINCKKI
jgi:hypothetical protein